MIKENDWRITNQESYLTGKTFYLHNYIKEETGTDHRHCEFCWDKLGQYEGALHRGYSTLDNYYWVCVKCFDDFKEQFEFKVFSEESFNGRKISQTIREETEAVFKNELIFEVQRIEALMGKL